MEDDGRFGVKQKGFTDLPSLDLSNRPLVRLPSRNISIIHNFPGIGLGPAKVVIVQTLSSPSLAFETLGTNI